MESVSQKLNIVKTKGRIAVAGVLKSRLASKSNSKIIVIGLNQKIKSYPGEEVRKMAIRVNR
jgi:hypothetical protein